MIINLEKLFFLLIINLILISSSCQINSKWADFKILNCEPVRENYLWAARTELTNLQYKEFLFHIKKKKKLNRFNQISYYKQLLFN